MRKLLAEVRACRHCEEFLPLGPNPVLRAASSARILLVGQAPGTRVHASSTPWDDPSGERLRDWMGIAPERFYDERQLAIIPMGFCYPGKGKSGDLPPRPECAELWHAKLMKKLGKVELVLLLGQYAQAYYLGERRGKTLTETVRAWRDFTPRFVPMPHPSPRNNLWLRRNPWFEDEVVPYLRRRVKKLTCP